MGARSVETAAHPVETGKAPAKLMSLREAVRLVSDGAQVAISGGMEMAPMALIREMIRAGLRDLRLVCVGSAGIGTDLLIGAGVLRSVEFSQISLGEYGSAPHFRRRFEQGAIEGLEHACPALIAAIQAGAAGIPFVPVRGLLDTEYMRLRSDFKTLVNPYDERERIAVVPAIRPDAAFFHAFMADTDGNVLAFPGQNNRLLAQAAKIAIVTAEEIVTPERLRRESGSGTFIPSVFVTAAVHAPFGAHPTACPGRYPVDAEHVREYVEASRSEQTFAVYLQRYAAASADEEAYRKLARVREVAL
jgi:glutaconate CoA-transferase subunit A